MTERWKDIEAIIDRVLSSDPIQRPTIIAEACAGDAELRNEVESLLEACKAAAGFLEQPALALTPKESLGTHENVPLSMPERVAGFKIIRVLGVGGMGVVYVAEQDRPHRTVALKVIKPGLATPSILRRFEHESEVLARLHHPGIAQVYEAATAQGPLGPQPYFAMELIDGTPITTFAIENGLGVPERLELLARVCDAVQHAHQQGVIHRDLKPSNILVDQSGQPKILDFGVARVSRPDGSAATLQTQAGQIIGTLSYMSPEQASGDSAAVDTRSDVYSLGVIGYQLLCGRLPVEVGNRPLHEGIRALQEEEPASLASADSAYLGDIDTMIRKALNKNKDHRYHSAAEFGLDLGRYLSDEPILARAPSAIYELGKFARRNRAWVAAAAGLAVVIVCSIALLLAKNSQLRIAKTLATEAAKKEADQRLIAEAETAKVRDALNTIQTMFRNDDEGGGRDLRVIDMLDQFAATFPPKSPTEQSLDGFRHHVVGAAYRRLGEIEPARLHLSKALIARQSLSPSLTREIIETQFELIQLDVDSGVAPVTPNLFGDLCKTSEAILVSDDPLLLAIRARLAWALWVCHDQATAIQEAKSVLSHESALAPTDPILSSAVGTLAEALLASGNGNEAIRALTERLNTIGPDVRTLPAALVLRSKLADCLVRLHRCGEAMALLVDVRDLTQDNVPQIEAYVTALRVLAHAMEGDGQRDAAADRYRQAIWLSMKINGEFHPITLQCSLDACRLILEDTERSEGTAMQAAVATKRAIDGAQIRMSRFHPAVLRLRMVRARALSIAGNILESEQEFRGTYYDTLERFGPDAPETVDALMWYSLFLVDNGRASTVAAALPNLYDYFTRTFGADYPETLLVQFHLGYANAPLHVAKAEELMQGAFQGLMKAVGSNHEWTMRVAEGLANFYESNGRPVTAASVRPPGVASLTDGWRPLLSQADVISLRVNTMILKAGKRSTAGDHIGALSALDAAAQLLETDGLLPRVARNEKLRDVLGIRANALGNLGKNNDALADSERSLTLAESVANTEPSDLRRRKVAFCLTETALYRARLERANDSREAFKTAIQMLKELTNRGVDNEHTWLGIIHASAFYGSLCASQAKRLELSASERLSWAADGIEAFNNSIAAQEQIIKIGKGDWIDEIFRSVTKNANDTCLQIIADLHRAEVAK